MALPIRINPMGQQIEAARTTDADAAKRASRPPAAGGSGVSQTPFGDLLRLRQGIAPAAGSTEAVHPDLHFSAHAQTRLQSRQITFRPEHLDRLNLAVQRAAGKGSRDALVLLDDMALVVSVKNRTVVTVVDKAHLQQSVFTNIDSAVIA